jgi:hypothetical protein
VAVKTFSSVRKRAKKKPQVITDNHKFDSIILDYREYENMFERINYLEDKLIYKEVADRIKNYERHPEQAFHLSIQCLKKSMKDIRS